jgi:hypothetical protein
MSTTLLARAYQVPLPPCEKAVLVYMAFCARDDDGSCYPSLARIELRTGFGRTAIKDARRNLVARGYLKLRAYPKGGRRRATEYFVTPPPTELSTDKAPAIVDNSGKGVAWRPVSDERGRLAAEKGSPTDPHLSVSIDGRSSMSARAGASINRPDAELPRPTASVALTHFGAPPGPTPISALIAQALPASGAAPRSTPRRSRLTPADDERQRKLELERQVDEWRQSGEPNADTPR